MVSGGSEIGCLISFLVYDLIHIFHKLLFIFMLRFIELVDLQH